MASNKISAKSNTKTTIDSNFDANAKNNSKSISKSNTTNSQKVIIKPLKSEEFDANNVEFSNVITNTELGNKWLNTTYSKNKFLAVARGCIIKTFKKLDDENKTNNKKDAKKDKYQIFMSLKDQAFIDMINSYDESLITSGVKNSNEWFDNEMTDEECREMFKLTLSNHEKYGYAIGGILGREFTCKSKTEDVPDVTDLIAALAKNTVVDVCFWFNKVKLGVGKYSVGLEINQINIISVGGQGEYKSNAIKVDEYEPGKITLTERQAHEKGGKFCKILYEDKPLRLVLENLTARLFRFEQVDEKVSYSFSIRLSESVLRKSFEGLDEEIFNILLAKSKEYYDTKKTAKLLRPIVKSVVSYNKADQEKIKKGEKPTYEPSVWIKVYYSEEKGFDNKIVNVDGNKPMNNPESLINKDLNVSSLEIYSKHIWFGPKGTSVNFTLNKCSISTDVPVYDMDDVAGDEVVEESEEEENNNNDVVEEEAVNSDSD